MKHLHTLQEHHVFLYGTLRNPKLLKKVLKHDTKFKEESTHGQRQNVKTYPNIVPEKERSRVIKGHEIEASKRDIKKLDNWEERYDRKEVKLEDGDVAYYYRLKPTFENSTNDEIEVTRLWAADDKTT